MTMMIMIMMMWWGELEGWNDDGAGIGVTTGDDGDDAVSDDEVVGLGNLVVFTISLDRDQILPISCFLLAEQLILCSAIRKVASSYNETRIKIEIKHCNFCEQEGD